MTERLSPIKCAQGYEQEKAHGESSWKAIARPYGVNLEVVGGGPSDIPANGPLVFITNHPYRILDGMMIGNLLDQTRGDFLILANSVFRRVVELNKIVLPILFDE